MTDRITNGVHAEAQAAIQRGWAIIPVHGLLPDGKCTCGRGDLCDPRGRGKHPIRTGWTTGPALSMADAYSIWVEEFPDANLGIRTGTISGIFVLDVDPDSGGWEGLDQLQKEHGQLPDTYTVKTGSGGLHYYYRMPGFPIKNNVKKLAQGVDIRADGGQVVAPPSRNSKGAYTIHLDHPVVSAPTWLLETLQVMATPGTDADTVVVEDLPAYSDLDVDTQERATRYATSVLEVEATRYRDAVPGSGNTQLFNSACNMLEVVQSPWNLLTGAEAYGLLERARVQRLATHPSGGGQSAEEFSKTWLSARGQTIGQGRPLPEDPSAGLTFDFVPPPRESPENGEAAPEAGGWGPDGEAAVAALMAKMLNREALDSIPAPTPLIRDVLDLDSESWIIGAPGGFKSFVALDWASHVALGLPWRGHPVTQGTVVYVVAEGKKGIPLRVGAWETTYGHRLDNVMFLPEPVQVKGPDSRHSGSPSLQWKVLVEACRRIGPVMIVLDTQARITVGINENDNGEMGILIEAVRLLREKTGACVLVVHHTGRNGQDARGASALDGAQDTEIKVERPTGRHERAALTALVKIEKQKDGDESMEWPVQLRIVDLGVAPDGRPLSSLALEPRGPFESAVQARPASWVENLTTNQGMVVAALREHSDRDGATVPTLRRWLKERADEGHGQALTDSSINSALRDLIKKGLIVKLGARYTLQEVLDADPLDE